MPKRKCTPQQLKNLAKGRRIRARNLKRKRKTTKKRTPPKKRRTMKRRRVSNDLTGGTGDVNPQLFSGKIATAVADTPITSAYITPISRLPKTGARATVMEILKVFVWFRYTPAIANVAETYVTELLNFGTKDHGVTWAETSEPSTFAAAQLVLSGAFTAGGTYRVNYQQPIVLDLTDNVGHGVLVATDYIYVQFDTDGALAVQTAYFKILYRFKNVPLTEYIGIVQSQQ